MFFASSKYQQHHPEPYGTQGRFMKIGTMPVPFNWFLLNTECVWNWGIRYTLHITILIGVNISFRNLFSTIFFWVGFLSCWHLPCICNSLELDELEPVILKGICYILASPSILHRICYIFGTSTSHFWYVLHVGTVVQTFMCSIAAYQTKNYQKPVSPCQ
jgi:hypothetical protein